MHTVLSREHIIEFIKSLVQNTCLKRVPRWRCVKLSSSLLIEETSVHRLSAVTRHYLSKYVEKCRERLIESLDRANLLKCQTISNVGAHSEVGMLARVMGSTQIE